MNYKEVVKHGDRIELRLDPTADYMRGDEIDIDAYLDGVLFWNDLYLEYNDWLYIYDANRGLWFDFPSLYQIDSIDTIERMLLETIETGEPLTLWSINDLDIVEDLNEGLGVK